MSEKLIQPRFMIVSCLLLTTVAFVSGQPRTPDAPVADQFETRCGWVSNPTPANMWLFDRDGQWIIGTQGGYQMEGDWDLPDFRRGQWVRTNVGSYGYGCACLRLRVNKETREVIEIKSSRARSLSACRRDRSLRRSGFK
jgi:hypothetical protein